MRKKSCKKDIQPHREGPFFGKEPKASSKPFFVQTKEATGSNGAAHEREANAVASRLVNRQTLPSIQTKVNGANQSLGQGLSRRLNQSKGQGQQLPKGLRHQMESSFGEDFRQVKVHTHDRAVQMNQDLGAQAFTHGRDVYFNSGKYQPESREGKRLLAHELTHVVQQRGGSNNQTIQRKVEVPSGAKLKTYGTGYKKSGNVYSASRVIKTSLLHEIFTAMLASPRIFRLAGSNTKEANQNFNNNIRARMGIVDFASKKKYSFGAGANVRMNPKYWIKTRAGWKVKRGVKVIDALDDLNKTPKKYKIACMRATQFTLLAGGRSPFFNNAASSLSDWVPGEAGYIKNDKFTGKPKDIGLEGENIIYTGKDMFWGHFTGTNTYRTLANWFKEVKSWNGAASYKTDRLGPTKGLKP